MNLSGHIRADQRPNSLSNRTGQGFSLVSMAVFGIFALLTIGFLFYETAIRLGYIPAFLGGYIGILTIGSAPLALLCYGISMGSRTNRFTGADAYLLFITFVVASVAAAHLDNDDYASAIAESHLVVAAQFITFFVIIKLFPLSGEFAKRILMGFMVAASLMVFDANLGSGVSQNTQVDTFDLADYQQFAIYYLIIMLVGTVLINSAKKRLFVYIVGAVILFYNGARTEFFGWLVAVCVMEMVRSRGALLIILLITLVAIPLSSVTITILGEYFPDNRITSLVENATQDQSYVERKVILDTALNTISENPVTGDYARYEVGRYAHNALSIWQDFGIIPFLVFVLSLVAALVGCVRAYREGESGGDMMLYAAVIAISVMFFAFSKAFSNPLYPMAMAMYAREQMRRSRNIADGFVGYAYR